MVECFTQCSSPKKQYLYSNSVLEDKPLGISSPLYVYHIIIMYISVGNTGCFCFKMPYRNSNIFFTTSHYRATLKYKIYQKIKLYYCMY